MPEEPHGRSKAITQTPETEQVLLVSWKSGFTLGRVTKVTPRFLRLQVGRYGDQTGKLKWAVRCWKVRGNENPTIDLKWCLWLPVATETAANMIFADRLALFLHNRAAAALAENERQRPENLAENQLRFLAKTHPRTVALFRAQRHASTPEETKRYREELSRAYIEETFACSGLLMKPAEDGDQILRMARRYAKMSGRKRKPDPVEREMIVGCYSKGYCRMTLPELQEAIRNFVGQTLTTDAIRQKWKRLGLPSERRRGRRRATPQK